MGDALYFSAASWTAPNGDMLQYGSRGKVVGPATIQAYTNKAVAVAFPGNKKPLNVLIKELSHDSPTPLHQLPLAGGLRVGDELFLKMPGTTSTGEKFEYGRQGTVVGPAPPDAAGDERVAMKFPGTQGHIFLYVSDLSNEPPPLEGGLQVGDEMYFTAESVVWTTGDRLEFGSCGRVMGPATGSRRTNGAGVTLLFPGNANIIGCTLAELSREPPFPSIAVEGHVEVSGHSEYLIVTQLIPGGVRYASQHRVTDFRQLHDTIQEELGLPADFPVAKQPRLFHSEALKAERVPMLQAYLRSAVASAKARGGMPHALSAFLQVPSAAAQQQQAEDAPVSQRSEPAAAPAQGRAPTGEPSTSRHRFCTQCGAPATSPTTQNFCGQCGAKL